ncbi:MAG: DUF1571 domain-containing protein [Thermoguttaceae bacterium]|nr:DUF1571 domain-containing protein [Thermoguttaceae bacterium]
MKIHFPDKYIMIDAMRTPLRFIAAFISVVVTTSGASFAQTQSILDRTNLVDYRVNRPIPYPTQPQPARLSPSLPVPEEQWQAFEQMINDARLRFETINRQFGAYACIVTMRETVGGKLQETRRAQMIFRAEPFSVYMKYITPDDIVGREIVYVEGHNNGRIIVTKGGFRPALAHITRAIKTDSQLAHSESNHSLKELGIASMMKQLLDVAHSTEQFPDCKIEFFENASIDNRACTVIQITHEPKSDVFPFYKGQVFIDNQYQVPVRFVCYNWPDSSGVATIREEFTYTNIIPNISVTDADFDYRNPRYEFKKNLTIPE